MTIPFESCEDCPVRFVDPDSKLWAGQLVDSYLQAEGLTFLTPEGVANVDSLSVEDAQLVLNCMTRRVMQDCSETSVDLSVNLRHN